MDRRARRDGSLRLCSGLETQCPAWSAGSDFLQEETVNCMDVDPILGWGLRQVELADRAMFDSHFASLAAPLSDYSFSQLYTWRKSLRIYWRMLEGHLCVFANGTGDLTLLMPPIGGGDSDRALRAAYELMDDYNNKKGVPDRSRVEYVSDELAARFSAAGLIRQPMGADYIYDLAKMVELPGGDLASKRQAKNRFMRNYAHRVEKYDASRHADACRALLASWKERQDARHAEDDPADLNSVKRAKESIATDVCLESASEVGLEGLVVWVRDPSSVNQDEGWSIRGFTFGEPLGADQSNITVEKTDLEIKGLAQFIFSEFCRQTWSHRPFVNVGDDWGLESIAWTKTSYRPVRQLNKYILRREAVTQVAVNPTRIEVKPEVLRSWEDNGALPTPTPQIRAAQRSDVAAAAKIEESCFDHHRITRRQLKYLQSRESAVFLVAERQGAVVGDGIALIRQHRSGLTGRIYSLAVTRECRGQKLGQRLLEALLEQLRARGVTRTYLEVDCANERAVTLYERSGFRPAGILTDYYGPGRSALHMVHQSAASTQAA